MALTSTTVNQSQSIPSSCNLTQQLLLSCIIGNALEWYDFVIYGYFAAVFGSLFFAHADPMTQILASWGIFWGGFLARPLGSIVFGHIGDQVSRKHALTLSILMMAIPTTLMGLLPTYQQAGVFAPLLLILLRTLQGFAIGGEFTGSMVFLVEHAQANKRGLWGSWASFSAVMGVIVGACLIAGLHFLLSSDAMQTWGWRVPFLISILGSLVGVYIRTHLSDPKVYLDIKSKQKQHTLPLKDLFLHHKNKMGLIICLDFLTAIGFFIVAIFLATYFRTYLKHAESLALIIHTFNMIIFALATLLGGWASDKIGRKPILAFSCIGFIVFSYPLFQLLQSNHDYALLLGEAPLAFLMGIFFGTIPATLAEMMPTHVRFSGLSIAHNICMAVVGGGAPFLASHLIHYSQDLASPAYLLIFASFISLCSLWFIKDKYDLPLDP